MKYQPTIGLEIHVQLKTKSKMFCSCDNNAEGKAPNTTVCPVCMGMPGVLPVPNKQAVEWAVKLGKFLGGDVASETKFDRKHYFYPDLPKGYQISQFDQPVVSGGSINIDGSDIRLERIHMEEDAGKLVHANDGMSSLVDLNRAGTPLLEIVTKPEITSPEQAKKFMQRLRLIVRYLDISDADMEKGHLRCDANISIAQCQMSNVKCQNDGVAAPQSSDSPATKLGTPVEIKNLNSFLMVERALKHEIERQSALLDSGEQVVKETRGWDDAKGKTIVQRTKEMAPDYRYFPEPDIPPLSGIEEQFDISLPESIDMKITRWQSSGLSQQDIDTLLTDSVLLSKADEIYQTETNPQVLLRSIKLIINIELIRTLPTVFISELARAIEDKVIGQPAVLPIIKMGVEEHLSVKDAIEKGGFAGGVEIAKLEDIIKEVFEQNPQAVADYKAGKQNTIGFIVGQVMRQTAGKADPQEVAEIIKKMIY